MRNLKVMLVILAVALSLIVADLWLLGKIHFARLWLTREQNLEQRQALEHKAKAFTQAFVIVNVSALSVAVVFAMRARSKAKQGIHSSLPGS